LSVLRCGEEGWGLDITSGRKEQGSSLSCQQWTVL